MFVNSKIIYLIYFWFTYSSSSSSSSSNDNNNSNKDRCYGVVVIARVHQPHLMNIEQRQAAAHSENKPIKLGREYAFSQLLSTPTIVIYC